MFDLCCPPPLSQPPASRELRPERPDRSNSFLENLVHATTGRLHPLGALRMRLASVVPQAERLAEKMAPLTDRQLREMVAEQRHQLHRHGLDPCRVATSFALIREMASRILGQRHYPCQLTGGYALLCNTVAEMQTGEGKTLTATLAAATAAMAGIPVHVISVNDYLTGRDAREMGPLYRALGLEVGSVIQGMPPAQRRAAYNCPITYVTNKEIVFDYLRDRLVLGDRVEPLRSLAEHLYSQDHRTERLLLRGLHFALVDEADSILIDEARTPLIISGADHTGEEEAMLRQALAIARTMEESRAYHVDRARRQILLTEQGRTALRTQAQQLGPLWQGMVWREGMISQALAALHLFHRDEQYLVRDGKIAIIDAFTGRVMVDRSWEQGLHQLIEVKEECELSQRRTTLAKISYQRFFRRYLRLSGMTGTATEVRREFWSVYGLPTVRIPTHRPIIRTTLPSRVYPSLAAKWQAVIARVERVHQQGRPVLIGTRSVAASEQLSQLMHKAGLHHQVLNARHDAAEAQMVSRAGLAGTITIATNMAGRGTDIKLGAGVRELGGLHVILTERHEAARIDRQLAGRCGRQGDPGSYEEIVSWEDPLLDEAPGTFWIKRLQHLPISYLAQWAIKQAQNNMESFHGRLRKELFLQDQQQSDLLSFSGRQE